MFGFSMKKKGNVALDTMIGESTEITGDIKFSGGLWVEGKIIGSVSADESSGARLDLAQGGCIIGDVSVPDIHIDGEVEGDIYATNRVELANNAEIKGNVYYNLLEMAMGAAINGNLVHKPKEEIRLLEHKSEQKNGAKKSGQSDSKTGQHGQNNEAKGANS